jgi:hypothetical protein
MSAWILSKRSDYANLIEDNRIDSFVGVYEDISSVEPTDESLSDGSSGENSIVGEMSFSGYRSMLDFSFGFTRQLEDYICLPFSTART